MPKHVKLTAFHPIRSCVGVFSPLGLRITNTCFGMERIISLLLHWRYQMPSFKVTEHNLLPRSRKARMNNSATLHGFAPIPVFPTWVYPFIVDITVKCSTHAPCAGVVIAWYLDLVIGVKPSSPWERMYLYPCTRRKPDLGEKKPELDNFHTIPAQFERMEMLRILIFSL